MNRKATPTKILIILIMISLSCSQNKVGWKGAIEEKDGVVTVKNPLDPMYGTEMLSLVEDLSIGDHEEGNNAYFSRISDVNIDQDGCIYILDGLESCLKIFDNHGNYLRTFGREGQGPGELQSPGGVYFSPKNEIVLKDQKGLNYFSKKGSFIKVDLIPFSFIGHGSLFDTEGNLIGMVFTSKEGISAMELRKLNPEFKVMQKIAYTLNPQGKKRKVGLPSLFWQVMPDDHILFSNTADYEIKIVNPEGKLTKKIIRKYVPIGFTEEEKEKRRSSQTPSRPIEFMKHKPAISWLLLSDQGYLLVRTLEKPENDPRRYYDIFDHQGRYLAKILLNGTLPRLWIQDQLYFIEEDDDGYPFVIRYKIKNWDQLKSGISN